MTKKDMLAAYERIREGGRKGGRKGGTAKTAAKRSAARANGARGGRPPTKPKAERLAAVRRRIGAGLDITPTQAALHYADKMGTAAALQLARKQASYRDRFWLAVVANLERGVR